MPGPPKKPWNQKAKNQPHGDRYVPAGDAAISRAPSRRKGIPIPDADPTWNPLVQSWFRSLLLSGQSELWEASDFATAVLAAKAYDVFLKTYNAGILAAFTRLSERLGVTFVDRIRARIELEEPEPIDTDAEAADATVLSWQKKFDERNRTD